MSDSLRRGFAALTLASWILAGCLGQLVSLHVESEHQGHHHADEHRDALLGLHASEPGAHHHQLSNARNGTLLSPRAPAFVPQIVHAPVTWLIPPQLTVRAFAPTPRPRGSPSLRTILLI